MYKENVVDIALKCATEAAKHSPSVWVELSTGQVYDSGKKPRAEDAKIKPWTKMAAAKYAAEEAVRGVSGLPVVVLRLAIVYGPGDHTGIMPRLVCGATYTTGDDKMVFLWDKDQKLNTVHIDDVCGAVAHAAAGGCSAGTYNLVDANDTDQGSVNTLIEGLFGISTGFLGSMKSKVATSVAMKTVADAANEKHLGPWSDLCKAKGITNTPLTPYLDEELLYNNPMCLDGAAFLATGYSLKQPKMTLAGLKASLQYCIDLQQFPADIVK